MKKLQYFHYSSSVNFVSFELAVCSVVTLVTLKCFNILAGYFYFQIVFSVHQDFRFLLLVIFFSSSVASDGRWAQLFPNHFWRIRPCSGVQRKSEAGANIEVEADCLSLFCQHLADVPTLCDEGGFNSTHWRCHVHRQELHPQTWFQGRIFQCLMLHIILNITEHN